MKILIQSAVVAALIIGSIAQAETSQTQNVSATIGGEISITLDTPSIVWTGLTPSAGGNKAFTVTVQSTDKFHVTAKMDTANGNLCTVDAEQVYTDVCIGAPLKIAGGDLGAATALPGSADTALKVYSNASAVNSDPVSLSLQQTIPFGTTQKDGSGNDLTYKAQVTYSAIVGSI